MIYERNSIVEIRKIVVEPNFTLVASYFGEVDGFVKNDRRYLILVADLLRISRRCSSR
jgi:hypothetical protein